MKTEEDFGLWNNTKGYPCYCKLCGYKFVVGDSLVDHYREFHPNTVFDTLVELIPSFKSTLAKDNIVILKSETFPVRFPNLYKRLDEPDYRRLKERITEQLYIFDNYGNPESEPEFITIEKWRKEEYYDKANDILSIVYSEISSR